MIISNQIRQLYDNTLPHLKQLQRRVDETISDYCDIEDFLFAGRIKEVDSLAEKIESGRYSTWAEIDDLYACTVVIPTAQDEGGVCDFLTGCFQQQRLIRRGSLPKDPDVFRFDATRFVGTLRAPTGFPSAEMPQMFRIRFEVQINTLFEFAWGRATHALSYKSASVDWRRSRLAAHLKAAVEQLDMLIVNFDQAVGQIGGGHAAHLQDQAQIQEFFSSLAGQGKIPSEVCPRDWSRFSDNVYRVLQAFSGAKPSGRSRKRLTILSEALDIIRNRVIQRPTEEFPRSMSLFQVIVGILAESGRFPGTRTGYFIPISDEMRSIFPSIQLPGEVFRVD